MTVRLLANESVPRPAPLALRAAGVDVDLVMISGRSARRRALPPARSA